MGALYRLSFPNGKSYIGITTKTAEARLAAHIYASRRGSPAPVHHAINKYGDRHTSVETLVVADDWGYLCDLERRAIVHFATKAPSGYNVADGGDGAPKGNSFRLGKKHTDEAKQRMSAARLGKIKHTDEARSRISAALMGNRRGFCKKLSPESRRKQSVSLVTSAQPRSTSGHRGVSWCRTTNMWRAHITIAGKMRTVGRFRDICDAVSARRAAEQEYVGSTT
jgi:group I intron endonuclease